MSGHSKWHNIQGRKGKQDAARGNIFSKLANKITLAAKIGGGNPDANFNLRLIIDKSKEAGMPKDNIERAINAGTGELKDVAAVEELTYEAFGPSGVAILIKILTNNKNRTAPEIKHILSLNGGNLGSSGSVQWMFELWGVARIKKDDLKISRDDFDMAMIEAGAEDISDDEENIEIKTKAENLHKISGKIKEMGLNFVSSGLEWMPKEKVPVTPEIQDRLLNLFAALDENEDVADYFTNAE